MAGPASPGEPPRLAAVRTFRRYLLFQIPGWILGALGAWGLWAWMELPDWAAVGLCLAWIGKDFLIYPLVRSAYETGVRTGGHALIGAVGVVHDDLAPRGYVKVHGELWRAEVEPPATLRAGTPIRVRTARGLTLVVGADPPPRAGGLPDGGPAGPPEGTR